MEDPKSTIQARFENKEEAARRLWLSDSREFRIAMESLPLADLRFIQAQSSLPETTIRAALVWNRWDNPICENCLDKHERTLKILRKCTRCYLSAYCSKRCQKQNWSKHKLRCGKINGPLDEGPQKIVLLSTDQLRDDQNNKVKGQVGETIKLHLHPG